MDTDSFGEKEARLILGTRIIQVVLFNEIGDENLLTKLRDGHFYSGIRITFSNGKILEVFMGDNHSLEAMDLNITLRNGGYAGEVSNYVNQKRIETVLLHNCIKPTYVFFRRTTYQDLMHIEFYNQTTLLLSVGWLANRDGKTKLAPYLTVSTSNSVYTKQVEDELGYTWTEQVISLDTV